MGNDNRIDSETANFLQNRFYSVKSNYGLVTFGVYFGQSTHIARKRDGDGEIMRLIAYSIIIIYRYFTIVATNSVHI